MKLPLYNNEAVYLLIGLLLIPPAILFVAGMAAIIRILSRGK